MSWTYGGDKTRCNAQVGKRRHLDDHAIIIGEMIATGTTVVERSQLDEAQAAAALVYGPYHPDFPTLPLQSIQVRQTEEEKVVEVTFSFYRRATDSTGVDPFTMPDVRTSYISERHYEYVGTSEASGLIEMPAVDATSTPTYWRSFDVQVPTFTLTAKTTLNASPLNQVKDLRQKVNGGTVFWSGEVYPANTIRFDAVDQSGQVVNGTAVFDVTYVFSIHDGGWNRYYPDVAGATNEASAQIYGTADFANGTPFPYT